MKRNILHLEASSGWGGQEMRILKESLEMRKRGWNIFFGVQKKGILVEKARKAGFIVYEVNFSRKAWFFSFFKLCYIIIKHKINIINTHSSKDAWLGGIVGRILRKKIIRTRHLSTDIKGGLNAYIVYNLFTDYIITTCASIIPMLFKKSKKEKKYIQSIPTGVDTNIKMNFKKIKKNKFLVGTMCFMRSWKGVDDFIKAAHLLKDHKDIEWVVIGGGHEKKYREFAKKLSLKNLFFTGHLENPFPKLAILDLFLLLSTSCEGVPQSLLQAAFLQKPLIGTPTGGIPEVCLEGETGRIVPIFSPEKVAKTVLELKDNAPLREKMQRNARKLVKEKFTIQKMVLQTEKIYYTLLKR